MRGVRTQVGELLRDTNLTFGEIAERVGVSRQRVHQIQRDYYPETPKRPLGSGSKPKHDYSQYADALLAGSIADEELAAKLEVKAGTIACIRVRVRKQKYGYAPQTFKRQLQMALRSIGCLWCWQCCIVKDLDQFPPRVRDGANGLPCTECNAAQQRHAYHTNPKVNNYYAQYRQEHPEKAREAGRKWRERTAFYRDQVRLFERIAAKDYDAAEAVKAGDLTLEEAAVKAGIRKPFIHHVPTVEGFYRAARRHLSLSERAELRELLR